MQLLHALAAGIPAAANGLVRLYRRGTATRATWYSSFEADSANSSGADIPLDSTGSAIVYVNEVVQVVVLDASDQQLRDFVSGEQAYAVEVRSQSFTGTDYTSGAQAAGSPTTDGDVLDRWLTSAGGIDWKGLYSGSSVYLKFIFGALYGLFYNVKSPEYGAVGDGVANDTAAFQAAHDAALAADGGVVVVPPGVYHVSAALAWYTTVSLIAVPGTVIIKQTTAGLNVLSVGNSNTGISTGPTIIYGIRFDSTVSNSTAQVSVGHSTGDELHFLSCFFGGSSNSVGAALVIGGTNNGLVLLRDCEVYSWADITTIYDTSAAGTGRLDIVSCRLFTHTAAFDDYLILSNENHLNVRDCEFTFRGTSGNSVGVFLDDTAHALTVSGCRFLSDNAGATNYAVQVMEAGLMQVDDSNYFATTGLSRYYCAVATDCAAEGSYLAMRPFVETTEATNAVTLDDWTDGFFLKCTGADPDVAMPKPGYTGRTVRIVLLNQSGGAWGSPPSFTASGGTSYRLVLPNLANLEKISIEFMASRQPGSALETWFQVSDWGTW